MKQLIKNIKENSWGSLLAIILILSFLTGFVSQAEAAKKAEAKEEEEVLTRGEAIMLISASDFVKKKVGELLSWTVGYDVSKVNRVKLTPTINYVTAMPKKIPPDGRTIFEIVASVDDPGGLKNIAGVRADLSAVGRLANTMLVDNGLFGDEVAGDGIYTLQTSIPSKIKIGQKEVQVAVANKRGWLALAKTTLSVKRAPVIVGASFRPEKISAGRKTVVTLQVKIDNPGRIEDMSKVTADLRGFGYTELLLLRNDGQGEDQVASDDIFTLQFIVSEFVKRGNYNIRVGASNLAGGYGFVDTVLRID